MPETLELILRIARKSERLDAIANLAVHLGADAVFVYVRDPELGVLLPAPGCVQAHPGGVTWRSFLVQCATPGIHRGALAFPQLAQVRRAIGWTFEDGGSFLFLGELPLLGEAEQAALATVGRLLQAEHAAVIARGAAAAAREAARHANALTGALDATRTDVESALAEAARLNLELKRAVESAREARADAEAANRAKDEFLAMLGHELRNPLAPIVTALELMKLRGDGNSKEHQVVARQIDHVIRLVDDLLDISRITRGKVELIRFPVQLSRVVKSAVEMTSPLLERRHHHLTVDVTTELWLEADENRLGQVLSNLLNNAAHYTLPGGKITLAARQVDDAVEIAVKDNGIGIEPEMLPRIFDLFVQGKRTIDRAEGGLGLGLALVQNLVVMHGGTVEARSEGLNRGSEFVVRLPLMAQDEVAERVPTGRFKPVGALVERRLRVMIVDDNADAAELLADLIRARGHVVAIAADGAAALGMVDEFRPDTAILDIGLPVMDGYELARQLRAREGASHTRLIAITGYGQDTDPARAEAAGFVSHLVKPVDSRQLLGMLDQGPVRSAG